ncbi:manganese-dependent inorganic pyrophosphatase [Peptococcus simiae]|uniref:manganese-dependent inorganic pyrophosphatase n=1 Tax=Peptococcus simiae TaxID=1643805 RepID=UPI00398042AD
MSTILVSGHQNPDTDSIISAISYAHLLNSSGKEAKPVALGQPNEETAFALDYFGFEAPEVIREAQEGDLLALVDHNEAQQSVPGRERATIVSVIDHHRIANFETVEPLLYRAEPVGCSNTIIYKLYREAGVEIPKNIAGLMLSAIISDTLLLKSPTCTPEDEKALKILADIAGVDVQTYGLDLLKAGTNLASKSNEDLLNMDAKSFPMGDKTVRIGQVNTVDTNEILARKDDLLGLMAETNGREGYDLFLLLATDILENNSLALVVGDGLEAVEAAFGERIADQVVQLPGVVSRKKQVVPPLTKALEEA